MALDRRIVLYSLVSGSCALFAFVLYRIASGLPGPRIGLTVVYMTALAIAIGAIILLVLTVIVRYKSLGREIHREIKAEAPPEYYPAESDDSASIEDNNATILLKKSSEQNVK